MMSEKNIYKYGNSYKIGKTINGNHKIFGVYDSLDDAVFIRNILTGNNWKLDEIDDVYENGGYYFVCNVIDDRLCLLAKYKKKPSKETVDKLVKKQIRNPNNSKYGLNIVNIFGVFVIKKQIAGDEYIFGYYDSLEDASFVRNFLLDHQWNVSSFGKIEFDDETDSYKSVKVIDDKVCVLASYELKQDASDNYGDDLNEFISKIYKNKNGIVHMPHLDPFSDVEFDTEIKDENWDLNKLKNSSAQELIFNLTPWQKIIYDNIKKEVFTFDELLCWIKRYKTKNFDKKVKRYLDELIDLNMVEYDGKGSYKKL